jgi:hypothetical protein
MYFTTFPFYIIMSYLTYDLDINIKIGVFITLCVTDIVSFISGSFSK